MLSIPHLETDVTTACQLSCVGCNHSVPLYRAAGAPRTTTPEQVYADLSHLATLLHAERWGALGGEPLLAHNLIPILDAARASKVADKIEVWTNGLLLARQTPEFWRAFDILVVSAYPDKHNAISEEWIHTKCEEEGVELVWKGPEFQTANFRTMLEPASDPARTREKFRACFFRQFSRVANWGYFYTCCCAPHLPPLMQGREVGADGILIEGLTEGQLRAYLERAEPLGACTICAGRDTARPIGWREERDVQQWLRASGLET